MKSITVLGGKTARVGDRLDNFGEIHEIASISRDGRTANTSIVYADVFHHGKEHLEPAREYPSYYFQHMRLVSVAPKGRRSQG